MTGKRSGVVAAWAAVIAGVGVPLSVGLGRPLLMSLSAGEGVRFLLWGLVGAAPWLVGAWLVLRRPRLGTVVLVTSAVLAAPTVVMSLVHTFTGAMGWFAWWVPVQLLIWAAMFTAGIAAWVARPRGGWRADGEVPAWLLAPIVLASSPVLLPQVAIVGLDGQPVGGWFATHLTAIGGVTEALGILLPFAVIAGGVIVLFRLRRGAAGAILLTAVGPDLINLVVTIVEAVGQAELQVMPGGVAALVGSAILVAVGTLWLVRDDAVTAPAGSPQSPLPVG